MSQLTLTGAGPSGVGAGYTYPAGTLAGEVERLTVSGDYSLTCGSGAEALPVEFVNNAGAVTISANTNWGNATADQRLLAVRVRGNLTIDATKTLTAAARKLGLFVLVDGDVTVNGTLSMTARGANHSATGSDLTAFAIRVHEATDDADNLIPAAGAAGASRDTTGSIKNGTAGTNGQTGGGGAGRGRDATYYGGAGANGTAYSGGAGGGGASGGADSDCGALQTPGKDGNVRGGAGGAGGDNQKVQYGGGGGAGNPGGAGGVACNNNGSAGENGTGGMLVLLAGGAITIGATGIVANNGATGGNAGARSGGGSGGGSITLYHAGAYTNSGTVQANGGATGTATFPGGAGGAGSIREVTL